MSKSSEPSISVKVDVTNPGQFFACCGLLELADRLWPGAEGWFDPVQRVFNIGGCKQLASDATSQFWKAFAGCPLKNTMSEGQVARRAELSALPKKELLARRLEDEKKALDRRWREAPILFGVPFGVRVDWFLDGFAGGSAFKTWAGQQSVLEIALAMKQPIETKAFRELSSENWLWFRQGGLGLPFNFDAALGQQGSGLDIGFSLDPLKSLNANIAMLVSPLTELLAFVGLQRFRPQPQAKRNRYRYTSWFQPLRPEVAAPICCGSMSIPRQAVHEFRLLYRTKYLKSFLPATPVGVS